MFTENQIYTRKIRTIETFVRHSSLLRDYVSSNEYQKIQEVFIDSALATVNVFYKDSDDSNPFGRDYIFYLNNFRHQSNPREQIAEYLLISRNPDTGLLEFGTSTISTENRMYNIDSDKINSAIKTAFMNQRPLEKDTAIDWMPHSKAFRSMYAYDLASLNLKNFLREAYMVGSSRHSFDSQYLKEIDAKIERNRKLIAINKNSPENAENDKLKKTLTFYRSMRHKTPSYRLYLFLEKLRAIGIMKQKKKMLFFFYKRNILQNERRILSSFFHYNPYHLNLLNGYKEGDNSHNEVKTRALYRRQALDRYPIFGKHLFSNYGSSALEEIDKGSSPEKALLRMGNYIKSDTRLEKGKISRIKYFQNLKWQRTGTELIHDHNHLESMLDSLSPLNKDHLPTSRNGWYALNLLIKKGMPKDQDSSVLQKNFITKSIIESTFGRNKSYGNVDLYSNFKTKDEIEKEISEIFDFIDDFGSKVVYPHLVKRYEDGLDDRVPQFEDSYPVIAELVSSLSLLQLKKMSNDWHSEQRMSEMRKLINLANLNLPSEWPKLVDMDYECKNGLYIVSLSNTVSLIEEGKRMSHCVGTYAEKCMYHGSNIVSIRDDNGCSLSTAEIVLLPVEKTAADEEALFNTPPSYTLKLIQHRGIRNSNPSEEEKNALNEFISAIKRSDLPISEDVVRRQTKKEYMNVMSQLHRRVGFNPDNSNGIGDMMLNYYSRYMNKKYKKLNYTDLGEVIKDFCEKNKDLYIRDKDPGLLQESYSNFNDDTCQVF